jgi:hypothetical protein
MHDLKVKLHSLSGEMSTWNNEVFREVKKETRELLSKLETLRAAPARIGPSDEENKLVNRLTELNHREEIMWKQRSIITWLSEGGWNTKYFHQRASRRKKKNRIEQLSLADGSVMEEISIMHQHTTNFYRELYTSEGTSGMDEVLSCVEARVTAEMNRSLDASYTEQEVKTSLFRMFPTKAPGPDGYPAHFYQLRHWSLCGEEVTNAVLNGHECTADINQIIVVLIPKVPGVTTLKQFRPISLCNVIMKIVTKAHANGLKGILPEIISQEQSAFVPRRLITYSIITAYECLHFMKQKSETEIPNIALSSLI